MILQAVVVASVVLLVTLVDLKLVVDDIIATMRAGAGVDLPCIYPWSALIITYLPLTLSALVAGSLLPAWRAAKMRIVEAWPLSEGWGIKTWSLVKA